MLAEKFFQYLCLDYDRKLFILNNISENPFLFQFTSAVLVPVRMLLRIILTPSHPTREHPRYKHKQTVQELLDQSTDWFVSLRASTPDAH